MLNIKRYALTLLTSAVLLTAVCPMTAFAMEGLADMQNQMTTENTGLTNANELEAGKDGDNDGANADETNAQNEQKESVANGSAQETGNAIDDILNNERYSGAISSIKKVTDVVDKWFIIVISLVAFFIISAAMLKNVCAGAYVANPKFWDIVHESHQKVGQQSIAGLRNIGQTIVNANFSSIRDILLVIVPDLKAFTDFEDASSENIDPKAYFAKSIPQMLLCVIIGIFIYNGYYRDTASKVGAFGAESFERFVGEADPVALADRLYNTTGKPKTKFDSDRTVKGKLGKSLSDKTYSLYVSTYHDLTGPGTKSSLMDKIISDDVDPFLKACDKYLGKDTRTKSGYEFQFSVEVSKATENPHTTPTEQPDDSNNTITVQAVYPLITNDTLGIHYTNIDPTTTGMTAVRFTVNFVKNVDENSNNSDGTVTITFHSQTDEVTKDTFNSATQAKGLQSVNKGTGVKFTGGNVNGSVLTSTSDGKRYTVIAQYDDKVAAGSISVGDPKLNEK